MNNCKKSPRHSFRKDFVCSVQKNNCMAGLTWFSTCFTTVVGVRVVRACCQISNDIILTSVYNCLSFDRFKNWFFSQLTFRFVHAPPNFLDWGVVASFRRYFLHQLLNGYKPIHYRSLWMTMVPVDRHQLSSVKISAPKLLHHLQD